MVKVCFVFLIFTAKEMYCTNMLFHPVLYPMYYTYTTLCTFTYTLPTSKANKLVAFCLIRITTYSCVHSKKRTTFCSTLLSDSYTTVTLQQP